jgi:two-component system CheB/CheR fusion protein
MKSFDKPRVVAIGASAGGLIAFQRLIENLPDNINMAFILLSHILRGSVSLLPEILSRSTKMPVIEVQKDTFVVSNQIYILPPDKFMEIENGILHLIPRPDTVVNNAINHFLFSLAKDNAAGSIGIILSGAGSDGAEGIKVLKEMSGGITMAQSLETATVKSMEL